MDMSKIRVRMGEIEVECEGTEAFLKNELPELLGAVSRLYNENGPVHVPRNADKPDGDGKPGGRGDSNIKGTTASLAGKLKVKSGNDLIIAAAAHLTFVAGKPEFSRQELLDQVRGATGYFKDSYSKNLTNYLNARVKAEELMEPRTGHYSLNASEVERLRAALAP